MGNVNRKHGVLDELCRISGWGPEKDEPADAFKRWIVRWFADKYPNNSEGNDAFSKLDGDVQEWLNSATEMVKNNKGPLPPLLGLDRDEGSEPAPSIDLAAIYAQLNQMQRQLAELSEIVKTLLSGKFDHVEVAEVAEASAA